MTATLESAMRPVDAVDPLTPLGDRQPTTVVVVDESLETDITGLCRAVDGTDGAVTIVVTRHAPPPCVIGSGAGVEATVMWNDCMSAHLRVVAATEERVARLTAALRARRRGDVVRIDCSPKRRIFSRRLRCEVEAVRDVIRTIRPDRVVIDPIHHLAAELEAQIAALTEVTASP